MILALTEPGSELAMVIDEDRIGWHLPPGDADRFINVLEEIYNNRDSLAEMGKRARQAAEEKYSLDLAISRYAREIGGNLS